MGLCGSRPLFGEQCSVVYVLYDGSRVGSGQGAAERKPNDGPERFGFDAIGAENPPEPHQRVYNTGGASFARCARAIDDRLHGNVVHEIRCLPPIERHKFRNRLKLPQRMQAGARKGDGQQA